MKFARFTIKDIVSYGIVEGDSITQIEGTPFEDDYALTDIHYNLKEVKLLSPTLYSKAVCIGLNYKDHAKEFGLSIPTEPVVFLKPDTCINDPESAIIYPSISKRLDYEAELAIVLKKDCNNVEEAEVSSYILGYCCANDITARDLQPKQGQWTIAKCFDGFLPLGPFIETEFNPSNAVIQSRVNGVVKQISNTSNLIFSPFFLVSYLSKRMTLKKGDVISTGTPGGISGMKRGDIVEIEIEKLGVLRNTIG